MFKFFGWYLNRRVLPDTGLRIFLLLRYRVENNPHLQVQRVVGFSRRDICFSTGLSYNSVQLGIKHLQTLGLIRLDPYGKGSKHLVKLTEPTEYNWELIQERLGFRFKSAEPSSKV